MSTFKCPHCNSEIELTSGPRPGGVTYAVHEWVKAHPQGTRTEALAWGAEQGYNPLTVLTQFAAARKLHFPK